jgi:hypothetical protein
MPCGESVSPELALVDPELASRLRAAMRLDDAAGIAIRPPVTSPTVTTAAARPAPPTIAFPPRGRAAARVRSVRLANGLAVGIVAVLALLPLLAFLPPRQAPTMAAASAPTTAGSQRTLAWPADPRATYYVVQLLRGNRLVHVSLPPSETASLPASLRPGSYTWRVYAGYGTIDANQRRGPIATGSFTVTRG